MKILKTLFISSLFAISLYSQENENIIEKAGNLVNSVVNDAKEIVVNNLDDIKRIEEEKKLQEEAERIKKEEEEKRLLRAVKINDIKKRIALIDEQLKDNILLKRYNNYDAYRKISEELILLKKSLTNLDDRSADQIYHLNNKIRIKKNELELISEYKGSPIGSLIDPPEIENYEVISNPFGILNALSYIKKLENNKKDFLSVETRVRELTNLLEEKLFAYLELYNFEQKQEYKEELEFLEKEKKDFNMVLEIVSTTEEVYTRKIEQVILETKGQISEQIEKIFNLGLIIVILFFVAFLIKLALKKYFSQNENYYMTNKIINFTVVFFVLMVLLFSYIDNVSYIVTILGFASAGIAIALKDWFMSIFGWLVIVTSGSISVGDRIKVTRDGQQVVGDVLDISLFKMTIREDITYTSYRVNRRTGRIFFIPNNYIFSEMIANYTHSGLRTVWDGIDIAITFDSNHKKAQNIVKNILKHYSKGYTDITRKQLSKMRSKYQLRATGVEPRVYTFAEPYGIVISGWYLTNSYSALVLRSTMSPEIIEAFLKEDDITIAYPTQTVNTTGGNQNFRVPPADLPEVP